MTDLEKFKKYLTLAENKRTLYKRESQQNKDKIEKLKDSLTELDKVQVILNHMEQSLRGNFITYIEELVSYGISIVFDENMKFIIEYSRRANMPVVNFYIEDSQGTTDIYGAKGGGLVNIVAFLLRVILLVHCKPSLQRIMFLDESFSMVSRKFLPNVAQLLRELSDKLQIQFVLITHEDTFKDVADKIYEVEKKNGISHVLLTKNKRNEVE